MSKHFYLNMALQNIQKNKRMYLPFLLASAGVVALYCSFAFLAYNTGLTLVRGGDSVKIVLHTGIKVMAVFSVIFLFYTNSFLLRQRKKELGLYCVLGMEKRHVAKLLFWESLLLASLAIGGGILLGSLFSKAAYALLLKIVGHGVKLGFMVPRKAISSTLFLFLPLFFVIYLYNYSCVRMIRPVELLQSDKKGEKEIKAQWLWAVASLGMLGAGYYIAITCGSPLKAINLFLIAVLLVIAGTYGLFQAGIIAILKLLQKNKGYYYTTKHFISLSGLLYRMKQNAVSLANICILSTMVLVMISTTATIYAQIEGKETFLSIRGSWQGEEKTKAFEKKLKPLLKKYGKSSKDGISIKQMELYLEKQDEQLFPFEDNNQAFLMENLCILQLVDTKTFEKSFGEKLALDEGEALAYAMHGEQLAKDIVIGNLPYHLIGRREGNPYPFEEEMLALCDSYFLVVKDDEEIQKIHAAVGKGEEWSEALYSYCWNLVPELEREDELRLAKSIQGIAKEYGFLVTSGEQEKEDSLAINGSLLFIGIFLGIAFLFATVLIIYYKQLTEGYEDSSRFEIMCKVGMSQDEVWASIKSQVLLVFFFPLLMAGLHLLAAEPCLEKILVLFQVVNVRLFAVSAFATFGMFGMIYVGVYGITARVYYHIVNAE